MPVQTSVITGTVAHKHSATGGSSDGGKLEVGGAGGDTSFNLSSGSIMYSNGTSLIELVKGSDGTSLQLSSGVPVWASAAGVTASTQSGRLSSTFTTSSSSFVTIGISITENNTSGLSIAQFNAAFAGDNGSNFGYAIFDDGTIDNMSYQMTQDSGYHPNGSSTYSHTADGSTLTPRVAALESGSLELTGTSNWSNNFIVSEIG
jgi:hypothetical protein